MNIAYFVATRKKLGFSQKELSDGICTQATLSRFEKNGQIPAVKTLIQLCNRLNISLGELFPKVEPVQNELKRKMEAIEFNLITAEYQTAWESLSTINETAIKDDTQRLDYLYLKGFLLIYTKQELADALFSFSQIIAEADSKQRLYQLLALTGSGMIYTRRQELEKADFYFNRVLHQIYEYPVQTTTDVWRVLNIVYHCGAFYASTEDYETSNALLNYALEICSSNHVTYYVARIAFRLAKNAQQQKKGKQQVLEYLNDACAFARINHNHNKLAEIQAFQAELDA